MSMTETVTHAADRVVNFVLVDITAKRNLGGQTVYPLFAQGYCVLPSLTHYPLDLKMFKEM